MSAVRAVSVTQSALPIIFLDIDEVICMSSPWGGFDAIAAVNGRHISPAQVYLGLFASGATSALKQIHGEMDAAVRYVISSTWRESFSREQLEIVFRSAGLGFVADCLHVGELWCTPPKFGRSRRVNEIAEWLDRHHQGEPRHRRRHLFRRVVGTGIGTGPGSGNDAAAYGPVECPGAETFEERGTAPVLGKGRAVRRARRADRRPRAVHRGCVAA